MSILIDPGLYDGMHMDVYHASPGVSSSGLKAMLRSPAHYQAYANGASKADEAQQRAFLMGTAVHAALQGGDAELFQVVTVAPKVDRRTNAGKKAWAQWESESQGRAVITADDLAVIRAMADSVRSDPWAAHVLRDGIAERSVFWLDGETGELCKCRPDYWRPDEGLIIDFKTCQDARPDAAAKTIAAFDYHLSAAMYLDGGAAERFMWIFVEKSPPYAVACYLASDEMLSIGRARYRRALNLYHHCRQADTWPAFGTYREINLPKWAIYREIEDAAQQ